MCYTYQASLLTSKDNYEIYNKPSASSDGTQIHYSQLMNATFNQPDTVINSANLWIPYTSDGNLYARIPAQWITAGAKNIPRKKKVYKSLNEAMKYSGREGPFQTSNFSIMVSWSFPNSHFYSCHFKIFT